MFITDDKPMSLVRTQASKNHIDQTAIDHATQGVRELINDPIRLAAHCAKQQRETGIKHDPEEQKRILRAGKVRCVQTNRAWSLKRMAELMMRFQKLFMQMHLSVLHAEGGYFLTSDSPVRVHNPATAPLLPKGFTSFEMLFPLSREGHIRRALAGLNWKNLSKKHESRIDASGSTLCICAIRCQLHPKMNCENPPLIRQRTNPATLSGSDRLQWDRAGREPIILSVSRSVG